MARMLAERGGRGPSAERLVSDPELRRMDFALLGSGSLDWLSLAVRLETETGVEFPDQTDGDVRPGRPDDRGGPPGTLPRGRQDAEPFGDARRSGARRAPRLGRVETGLRGRLRRRRGDVVAIMITMALVLVAGEIFSAAGTWGLVYGLAPESSLGQYQGVFRLGTDVSMVAAPTLFAWLVDAESLLGWVALAGVFLVAAVLLVPISRSRRRPAAGSRRRRGEWPPVRAGGTGWGLRSRWCRMRWPRLR